MQSQNVHMEIQMGYASKVEKGPPPNMKLARQMPVAPQSVASATNATAEQREAMTEIARRRDEIAARRSTESRGAPAGSANFSGNIRRAEAALAEGIACGRVRIRE